MEVCNKKIIKVMIPCYNVEKYISRCIDSVLNQNYDLSCIKIVCINDGSTDNTLQILKEYKARLGKAFELHTQKNKGI
jgi:glycosyltransferase involved in cell wall biosynthesis